jgi:formylglycine-generating enzyme required for sulfatase activity
LGLLFVACTKTPPPAPSSTASAPIDATAALPSGATATATATATSAPDADSPMAAGDSGTSREGMLVVPGGTFTVGADIGGQEDEHPAHPVDVVTFWLDRTEVTNEAYESCVAAGACKEADPHIAAHSATAGPESKFHHPKQPVCGVTWDDARAYCTWRKKRLPREVELERAVRGDDGRRFPWGNEPPTPERTVFGRDLGRDATDDVGSHPAGKGPYGHDDLAGNVWEWLEDDYDPYAYRRKSAREGRPGTCPEILAAQKELREQGKQGFTGSNPIPTVCEKNIRSGAYNYDGPSLRSTNRVHHPGTFHLIMTGFRCAAD